MSLPTSEEDRAGGQVLPAGEGLGALRALGAVGVRGAREGVPFPTRTGLREGRVRLDVGRGTGRLCVHTAGPRFVLAAGATGAGPR